MAVPPLLAIAWTLSSALGLRSVAALLQQFPLLVAAALVGSRIGVAESEDRILFVVRLGQLAAQGVSLGFALCLLGAGIADPEDRMATVFFSGGLSLLLWTTTAAATRFARSRAVLLGPMVGLAVLLLPLAEQRLGSMLGWENAVLLRWKIIVIAATLVAAWPRRSVPDGRRVARPVIAVCVLLPVADLLRGWVVGPHWSTYSYVVSPSSSDDGVAWVRISPFDKRHSTGGTMPAGAVTDLPKNSFPHAGPNGSAVFISLGWRARGDATENVPMPNVFLFVPSHAVLACETNSSAKPNWRPDGKAASVGQQPVTILDADGGCVVRPGVLGVGWLASGIVEWTGSEIVTTTGRRWSWTDSGSAELVQAGAWVYLSGESGIWLVTDEGPTRLGDRPAFGGEVIFADGACFGVPESGFRCWRGSEELPPIAKDREPVALDQSRNWGRSQTLLNSVSSEKRELPDVGAPVEEARVRGRRVDLFGPHAWYSWQEGQPLRAHKYEP